MGEEELVLLFKNGVSDFKRWARKADKSSEEWETEYPNWNWQYHDTGNLLKELSVERWNEELIEDFLYILARDNEVENIIENLIDIPNQLLSLTKYALIYSDADAKWQVAYGLGEIKGDNLLIRMYLSDFLNDEQEYVRRRASFALDKHGTQ
ncbi:MULTISPECIES: hypothetical protein [Psychrobacillus]|uniref:HEAT repeat domain-containing protein n=1 Tax=Psychrobacillus faecigallinarum TaxID=2762235 RepID=A0ABR8R9B5_9BACI|nr:hypothetical protein [Psychrobacillus faecigallinarum]MBD7944383.1 hypothetical protein [Psychrobacillus faecigallinarum]